MTEETIAPSPNWYLSTILDVSASGSVAYGSKNAIIILSPATEHSSKISRDVVCIPAAHRDRVNAVSYGSQSEHKDKLASIGGDNFVKTWDTVTKKVFLAHQAHGENVKLMGVDWSRADPQLVMSVDDAGMIVTLDVASKTTHSILVPKLHATVIACCPHRRHVVAVGDTVGLVSIINTAGSGSVLHRMRGHDTTVVSLSWCPAMGNPMRPDASDTSAEMMLASSAKSRNIIVWRAGTDGKCQTALELPSAPLKQIHQQKEAASAWIPVCWAEYDHLLTGSTWGETLRWDLSLIANKQKKLNSTGKVKASLGCSLLASVHGKGLFSLACSGKSGIDISAAPVDNWRKPHELPADKASSEASSWRDKAPSPSSGPLVWSTGQDRNIVCSDLATGAVELVLPTIGGFVYCLAVSPIDSHKVAFGAGDGMLRVWNMAAANAIDLTLMWMKISGKVTSLAWHPSKETWLAYGTSDGRVGIYDISCVNKGPLRLWTHHHSTVYVLGWGPPTYKQGEVPDKATTFYLYSCGDGDILQYNPDKRDYCMNVLQGVAGFTKKVQVSEFSWKQDNSLLAIGTDTGCVMLCQPPHLATLATVYPQKKTIQSMVWHPLLTATEPGGAPARHWMAIASTLTEIKVYNFAMLFKGANQVLDSEACIATLTGHTERITCVAWSPHISCQLVSTSYDRTVQVWDVRDGGKLLAVYDKHEQWVYCCVWSPLNADFMLSGSGDFTLRLWRISQQPTTRHSKKFQKSDIPMALPLMKPTSEPRKKVMSAGNILAQGHDNQRSYFPVSSRARNGGKDQLLGSTYSLMRLLKQSPVLDNEEKDLLVTDKCRVSDKTEVAGEGDLVHLGFFTDAEAMHRLLKLEEDQLMKSNNRTLAQDVALWESPNFLEVLERAKRDKRLTDWHIAMAPMVSPRVWREMAEAYALQLSETGQIHKAVSMLMACRQVKEAVQLLIKVKLFREAVAIARCQLNDGGNLAKQALSGWAALAESTGDFELAVHCLISTGELERAATLQGCRRDSVSLRLASCLARLAGVDGLAMKLAQQAVEKCLVDERFDLARSVVQDQQHMKSWLWLIASYEDISHLKNATRKYTEFAAHLWGWFATEPSVPSKLIHSITSKCDTVPAENITQMVKSLEASPGNQSQLWLLVSAYVAAGSAQHSDKFHYFVKALSACYHYEILFPQSRVLLQLVTWILSRSDCDDLPEVGAPVGIKAFVCEGIAKWIQTLLTHLQSNEDNTIPLSSDQWEALTTLLVNVVQAAFNANAIFYFQAQEEIEKCERAVAEARSQKSREDVEKKQARANADIKKKKKSGIPSKHVENEEVEAAVQIEKGTEVVDKSDVELSDCVEDLVAVVCENGTANKGKADESSVTVNDLTNGVDELKLVSNIAICEEEKDEDAMFVRNPDWILLGKLRDLRNEFIEHQVAAPNPFSVYFMLSYITNNASDVKGVNQLKAKTESVWKAETLKAQDRWTAIKADIESTLNETVM